MNDRFLSVSVTEFARDWIRMVAKADPSAPGLIDFEGFELALRDLVGPPDIRSVPSREIELIASILPQFPARLIDDLKRDLARLEALRQVAIKLTWLFHTARGSSLDSSTLREARRDTIAEFIEVLSTPLERVFRRFKRAERRRERRENTRPIVDFDTTKDNLADQHEPQPFVIAASREAAGRIVRKLGTELSPTVLAGLRACFVNPAAIPSIIARRFGVSPAALTRAQAKLHELARVELRECSPEMAECLLNAMYEAFSNA